MVCAVNTPRWAHSRVVAGVRPRSSACAAMPLPSDLGRSITGKTPTLLHKHVLPVSALRFSRTVVIFTWSADVH